MNLLAVKSNNYYYGRNGVRPSIFMSLIINNWKHRILDEDEDEEAGADEDLVAHYSVLII